MRRRWLWLSVLLGLGGCFDSGASPHPGSLTAMLQSPNGDEGAAVVRLLGEGVLGVDAIGATEVYSAMSPEGARVVLISMPAGALTFSVDVADTGRPPSVLFQEVAGPDDELRDDLSGYRVLWSR